MTAYLRDYKFIVFLACIKFIFFGLFVVLPWSNPDEIGHYSYIREVGSGNFLPTHGIGQLDPSAMRSQFGNAPSRMNWILGHPPLYYYILSPFSFLTSKLTTDAISILLILRVVNAFLSGLGLFFLGLATRRLTNSASATLFTIAVVAFSPLYVSLSGGLSNDIAVFTFCSLAAWFLVESLSREDLRLDFGVLAALSAASLSKTTAAPLLIGALSVILLRKFMRGNLSLRYIGVAALAVAPLAVWHAVGFFRYGNLVRLGSLRTETVYSTSSFSIWRFFTDVNFVDTLVSTFYGFMWLVTDKVRMVTRPQGEILSVYAFTLCLLLLLPFVFAVFRFSPVRRNIIGNIFILLSLLISFFVAYKIKTDYISVRIFIFMIIAVAMIFCSCFLDAVKSNEKFEIFVILSFCSFVGILILSFISFYNVFLIYGEPRALHGRYLYGVAPFLIVSIAGIINKFDKSSLFFTLVFVFFTFTESLYWSRLAVPSYTLFELRKSLF